jgi:multicomponent K+:H+ antiporter subunit D
VLLIELVERSRPAGRHAGRSTMEAYAFEETPEQPVGVGIPAALAFVGLAFAGCALVIIGLPPLSGFVAKFGLLHGLLAVPDGSRGPGQHWLLIALLLLTGFAALIALLRTGVRTFWASGAVPARLQVSEAAPVTALLILCVLLTVQAGPVIAYLERTGTDLQQPSRYSGTGAGRSRRSGGRPHCGARPGARVR